MAAAAAASAPDIDVDYPVLLGESFTDRVNFHVLRYEFKPASADLTKTGLLTVSSNDKAIVDLPNKVADGQPISFTGKFQECRDVECILIFDAKKKLFRLEQLSATVKNLRHDRRGGSQAIQRLASLPAAHPPKRAQRPDAAAAAPRSADSSSSSSSSLLPPPSKRPKTYAQKGLPMQEIPRKGPPNKGPPNKGPPSKGPPHKGLPTNKGDEDDEDELDSLFGSDNEKESPMLDMAGNPIDADDLGGSDDSFSSDESS